MAKRLAGVSTGLAFLFVAGLAGAQSERKAAVPADPVVVGSGPDYTVAFDDDPLAAIPNGALIPRLIVRGGTMNSLLLRARTSFVPEMLKSVEALD